MASSSQDHDNSQYNGQAPEDASSSPLLTPMSTASMTTLCAGGVIGLLAIGWCILDYWNRQITGDLFNLGNVKMMDYNQDGIPEAVSPFKQFSYPLTLAFLQFAFMGVVFTAMHYSINQERPADLMNMKVMKDKRWPAMVVTHVFSTFWLQALMLPAQMLSIGLFAASRATEIPVAAYLRAQVLGPRYGKRLWPTVGLATSSACIMFFSYAMLAGCACVWSGNGVALSGLAFWLIYLMLLAMPAANCVCQEAIMTTPGMHPILLLALQNIFACLLFGPVLMFAHLIGWEDVSGAFEMILTYSEVFMLVLWLCGQMAVTSMLCITLIYLADSFWTVALRALRVVLWAISMIATFYFTGPPGVPISIACPHTSIWAFILLCSVGLGAASIMSDRTPSADDLPDKSASKSDGTAC